jgi:hypothetical protein
MDSINFSDGADYEGARALVCPFCGGDYLHHEIVSVFDRAEDDDCGQHLVVAGSYIHLDTDMNHNPSPRRGGLSIGFVCEQCDGRPRLDIFQHKGQTFVGWYSPDGAAVESEPNE